MAFYEQDVHNKLSHVTTLLVCQYDIQTALQTELFYDILHFKYSAIISFVIHQTNTKIRNQSRVKAAEISAKDVTVVQLDTCDQASQVQP